MEFLDENSKERIHKGSLRILNKVGVKVDDEEVLSRLAQRGAEVNLKDKITRFDEDLVAWALKEAPSSFSIGDLKGREFKIGPGSPPTYWTANALNIYEEEIPRPIDSESLARLVRLADALPNVNAVVSTHLEDVPIRCRDFVGFRILAENSQKHLRPVIFTGDGIDAILEMAEVLTDERPEDAPPIFSLGYSILSPLHWNDVALGLIQKTSGRKIPFMLNAEPLAGATSPVTLAGSLVLANAEVLSGIVIAQTLEPGRPVIFNMGFAHILDMRTTVALTGAPETSILASAGAEMSQVYNLPSASWVSTEAPIPDEQASFEKALAFLAHSGAGVNAIWGVGQIESQLSQSFAQMVIDNEIIGYVKRLQRGVKITEEHLALAEIEERARSGDFLSSQHTLKFFRDELSTSRLVSRNRRVHWEEAGGKSLRERAEESVREILQNKKPPLLSDEKCRQIRKIEARWRKVLE